MLSNSFPGFPYSSPSRPGGRSWDVVRCKAAKISEEYKSSNDIQAQDGNLLLERFPQIWIASKTSLALGRNFRLSLVDNSGVHSIPEKKKKINEKKKFDSLENQKRTFPTMTLIISNTVNDRLSAAALISFSSVIGAVLTLERRLFESGAYFNFG